MNELVNRLISPVLRKDWATVHHIVKDVYILSDDTYENFVRYLMTNMKNTETEDDVLHVIKEALRILERIQALEKASA